MFGKCKKCIVNNWERSFLCSDIILVSYNGIFWLLLLRRKEKRNEEKWRDIHQLNNLFLKSRFCKCPLTQSNFQDTPTISALPLFVSWVCLAVNEHTPPPQNKETVFAAPLQCRFGLHPCNRLDTRKMLTLSQQWWSVLSRGVTWRGLDGADSGWWQEQCAGSSGEGAKLSESTSCWWGEGQT